jgi:hypothetical protein
VGIGFFLLLLLGCTRQEAAQEGVERVIEAQVQQAALRSDGSCSGRFIAQDLPHVTGANIERVGFFLSNGAGLAVNDLDNDGDNDIVLGNLLGPNHIFWNEGDWQFRPEVLFDGSARAIAAVDVDADGWLDIVIATRNGDVRYWHNGGQGRFAEARLPGVTAFAYSLDWNDVDGDGDLDLLTASYDASLEKQNAVYRESRRAGVSLYTNEAGQFSERRLANEAQALAAQLVDLNEDGRPDILVGNDFEAPDYAWLNSDTGWQTAEPFAATTMSTMSYALGDVDNNGRAELFAADMHPYSDAPEIMAQWQPVMDSMTHEMVEGDPQQMANVLQVWEPAGVVNTAVQHGIAASGWSWSSQFGDLDQDGFLDLYVVNGMQALDNFSHLPNDELIEENQVYHNDGLGHFIPKSNWGLNSTYGGRSMVMADLDGDGDLDIAVNNLQDPAQLFENQLCLGQSLLVDARWPGSQNPYSIGATLILHTSTGDYRRVIQTSSGYLSGIPARVHFGLPVNSTLGSLEVVWPDGEKSVVEGLQKGNLVRIERR